ncbi:MAG: hypothetical protein V3V88_03575 [Dehalococcoidia bacterium]
MANSNTTLCNQALGRIGAKRINNFEDSADSSPQAIQCRLHFEQTRDALMRSHWWRFARDRVVLSQDTTDPDFEWDNQFILPSDMLRARSVFSDTQTRNTRFSYELEGDRLLTNQSAVNFRYIKKITDPTKFDSLFVEVLVLLLAIKLVGPLAGANVKLTTILNQELRPLMKQVRAIDRQETNTRGKADRNLWNDARFFSGGRIDSQLGS